MDFVHRKLAKAKQNNHYRSLPECGQYIDFYSNDYLGLAYSQKSAFLVKELMKNFKEVDRPGSRLISGNSPLKENFESFLASMHGTERALLYNSGYAANTGFWGSIMERNLVVFYDDLVHASIRDGLRLSRLESVKFKHNDWQDLRAKVIQKGAKPENCFLAIESLYSMDGDQPDWQTLKAFLDEFPMKLVIDEAHSAGVFGHKGTGLLQQHGMEKYATARIHTFGKGLGSHGAVILANEPWVEYLINFSRPFIYTTALPNEAVARTWVSYLRIEEESLQNSLFERIFFFKNEVMQLGLEGYFHLTDSPIQVLYTKNTSELEKIEQILKKNHFGIKAIFTPTVPKGKERIRITLHAHNSFENITRLMQRLAGAVKNN